MVEILPNLGICIYIQETQKFTIGFNLKIQENILKSKPSKIQDTEISFETQEKEMIII
jgi:hypothetical protein